MGAAINLATDYTEVDPNSRITLTTVTAAFTAMTRNESAYVYKDWGSGFFGSDFIQDIDVAQPTQSAAGNSIIFWGVTNSVGSMDAWAAGLYLRMDGTSGTSYLTFTLGEIGGSTDVGTQIFRAATYWRIVRSGTTITAYRATSAANRTAGTWAETHTLTIANTSYQYHYALSSINDAGSAATVTGSTINVKGTKMSTMGTPFSTEWTPSGDVGNWDSGATWGNAGSSKGTDYPGNASDTFYIHTGHTVVYNVSETNALLASTISGTLSFKKDANTKLTFGHVFLTISAGATLNMGTEADPIESGYTAELLFASTSDSSSGISSSATGTINMYGTDLTGGVERTYLTADWSSGQTFTVKGNVTSLWAAGQKLAVQRFLATYPTAVVGGEYTIASMALNGSDTDVTISEAAPGVTFRAGGLVLHTTRNVIFGKSGPTLTLGTVPSNKPNIIHPTTSRTTIYFHAEHAVFQCVNGVGNNGVGGTTEWSGCVVRNSNGWGYNQYNRAATFSKMLFITCTTVGLASECVFDNCVLAFNSRLNGAYWSTFTNCYFIANYFTTNPGNHDGNEYRDCDWVENRIHIGTSTGDHSHNKYYNCNFGKFRHNDNQCTCQSTHFSINRAAVEDYYNCWWDVEPPTFYTIPSPDITPTLRFQDHNGVVGDGRTWKGVVKWKINSAVTRPSGNNNTMDIYGCGSMYWGAAKVPLFEWVEWDVPASAQTRAIYAKGGESGELWTDLPTADELYFRADYLDASSGGRRASVVSTVAIATNSTWTALGVSFTPAQVGPVVYSLRLGINSLAGWVSSAHLYVDPQLNN